VADHKVVKFRRGTTLEHTTFAGAEGELTVDTDKHCVVVHDGHTVGGYPLKVEAVEYSRVRWLVMRAAMVTQGVAGLGFSSPRGLSPEAIAYVDDESGLILGVASFAPGMNQSIQDHFLLPDNWVDPMTLDITWRTNTTIGTAIWKFESCCVPVGTILEENFFNAPQEVSTIVSNSPQTLTTSTLTIDTTNFQPNGELFFQLSRDGGDDTVNATLELVSIRFGIRIQEK
jgi:Major tropism determinant N-terminal domain